MKYHVEGTRQGIFGLYESDTNKTVLEGADKEILIKVCTILNNEEKDILIGGESIEHLRFDIFDEEDEEFAQLLERILLLKVACKKKGININPEFANTVAIYEKKYARKSGR